jgi:inner membrane protein
VPNGNTHLLVGAGLGFAGYLVYCQAFDRKFELGEALLAAGACVLGSVSPDILEPAVHPWHRGPCHSMTAGSGAARLAWTPWTGDSNFDLATLLLGFFALGYLSHLMMDACTPRGVPLLR